MFGKVLRDLKLVKGQFNVGRLLHNGSSTRQSSTFCQRTHHCGELNEALIGEKVKLCGWVHNVRLDLFLLLRDSHGYTQIVLPKEGESATQFPQCTRESILSVEGSVRMRPSGQQNKKMSTGSIEIVAETIEILNPAKKDLPFQIQEHHQITEQLRMKYRYMDLRSANLQKNLRTRSEMVMKMREYLCNSHGFVDVETPTLFRKTPGGAREFIVPTHQRGKYYCLPQSPQQFKQLLMAGGIDRYMQIARCYRDETANADRQPEFTQVDLEMSFVEPEDIKSLIEGMLNHCWPSFLGSLLTPFPTMTYAQAISEYGIDKPDTRFGMKINEVTSIVENCSERHSTLRKAVHNFPTSCVKAINFKNAAKVGGSTIKRIKESISDENVWNIIVRIRKEEDLEDIANIGVETSKSLKESLDLQIGDVLLLAAGPQYETCTLLGKQRLQFAQEMEHKGETFYDKSKFDFLWVEDFPLFLPKEDSSATGELESAHHPFTAPHPDDAHLLYTNPSAVRGRHYDLVLNGSEIGGGSIRVHNAQVQRHILDTILKEDSSTMTHLLDALDSGCPPHGGIALGLDRLIAIVCDAKSIRDVIAFPKSINGRDPMSGAPAEISEEDLAYYLNHTDTKDQ